MKIAIIDDSNYKINSMRLLINGNWPDVDILVARSFQTAMKLIENDSPDIILLDMTLPTSERQDGRLDGRTRIYGGRELLAEIDLLELNPRVIIVTQFEEFQEGGRSIDLKTLLAELKSEFPGIFAGGVFYGSVDSAWMGSLEGMIKKEINR